MPGDLLILTKPVGTGVILAGERLKMASEADAELAKMHMKTLNRSGAEVMKKYGIKGATDITGYGLAGHALKMAKAGNVSLELNLSKFLLSVTLSGSSMRDASPGLRSGTSNLLRMILI